MENTTRNGTRAGRTEVFLRGLLVRSPGQRDIIKTVALLLMMLDHSNRILQLHQDWMFYAGRGAFPLFALVWGMNLAPHVRISQSAVNRLWGWALLAQPGFFLAGFPWYEGNILFTFAVAAQVLRWRESGSRLLSVCGGLFVLAWLPLSGSSYGITGLVLLALCRHLYREETPAGRLCLAGLLVPVILVQNHTTGHVSELTGLLMTGLVFGMASALPGSARLPRFWPQDLFPVVYAGHLALLGCIAGAPGGTARTDAREGGVQQVPACSAYTFADDCVLIKRVKELMQPQDLL